MILNMMQRFFASLVILALVATSQHTTSPARTTTHLHNSASTALTTSSAAIYPPPGLLDSLSSMKIREDLYQHNLSTHAIRAAIPQTVPIPISILPLAPTIDTAVLASIESVFRTRVLPSATGTQIVGIATAPPTPPAAEPTASDAPQLHTAISVVWIMVIIFIALTTLSSALGGLGNAITFLLILNLMAFLIMGAEARQAQPDSHLPHAARHALGPLRRPIGGLRAGPEGKIPCGPGVAKIGEKKGSFLKGVHRKIGGLRPGPEFEGEGGLMCDDWAGTKFGRAVPVIATPPSDDDDVDLTTTRYTMTTSTVLVTVPEATETVTTFRVMNDAPSSATISTGGLYSIATETSTSEPTPSSFSPFETPSSSQESSAIPPTINIRSSVSYLLLLYLTGMLLCLLLGGSSYALSFLLISFALASIIAGAEAAAVPDPTSLYSTSSWRVGGVRPAGVKTIAAGGGKGMNHTHGIAPGVADAGLKKLCGEVFCHNWSNSNVSTFPAPPTHMSKKLTPSLTYADLAKRLSTLYITVPPTSGVIEIQGPQIIPVTVVSTAYAGDAETTLTVDVVTERSTRTKVLPAASTMWIMPGTSRVEEGMGTSGVRMGGLRTVTSGETTSTVTVAPAPTFETLEEEAMPKPSTETVFVTTTYTAPPSSSSSSFRPSSTFPTISSATLQQTSNTPLVSSGAHLDPKTLYLSFVETNLYCFLFLLIGLNIALTIGDPLCYLGSIGFLMVSGAAVVSVCRNLALEGGLRCNGVV